MSAPDRSTSRTARTATPRHRPSRFLVLASAPALALALALGCTAPAAAADDPPPVPEWINGEWARHEGELITFCGHTQCSAELDSIWTGTLCKGEGPRFGCRAGHAVTYAAGSSRTFTLAVEFPCYGPTIGGTIGWTAEWSEERTYAGTSPACHTCEIQFCWPRVVMQRYRCSHRGTVLWKAIFPDQYRLGEFDYRVQCWSTPDFCHCDQGGDGGDGSIHVTPGDVPAPKPRDSVTLDLDFIPGIGEDSSLTNLDLVQLSHLWFYIAMTPHGSSLVVEDSDSYLLLWPSGEVTTSTRPDLLAEIDRLGTLMTRPNALRGDLDGSGAIDGRDVYRMTLHMIESTTGETYQSSADLDGDGAIDAADLAILLTSG